MVGMYAQGGGHAKRFADIRLFSDVALVAQPEAQHGEAKEAAWESFVVFLLRKKESGLLRISFVVKAVHAGMRDGSNTPCEDEIASVFAAYPP